MTNDTRIKATAATVKNINVNAVKVEGGGKAVELYVDLEFIAGHEMLGIVSTDRLFETDWKSVLWHDSGAVKTQGLKALGWDCELEDEPVVFSCTAAGEQVERGFEARKVKKITTLPTDGYQLKVSLQVHIRPDAPQVGWLTDLLTKESVGIVIGEPDQADAFADAAE